MPKKAAKAPVFVEMLQDIEVKAGETVIIDCVCVGEPEPDVDWYFEGKIVKDEGRYRYLFEENDVVGLEIRKVTAEDEGVYKCVAFNKSGEVESKCELLVNASGKIVDAPRDATYEENQSATFKCKYDGNPRPEVKWFQGKKEIKNGDKYLITNKNRISSLEIDDLTLSDGGWYSVVVNNDGGEDEVSIKLTVNPNKAAPRKAEPKKEVMDSAAFQKKSAGRVFMPKKKKNKLPVDRPGIKAENPEKYYTFGEEIGRGKFSVVKEATSKKDGSKYAAKIIKFDSESLKFAIREYDIMTSEKMTHKALAQLHEAYLVRKYLIIIMNLCDGKTLLNAIAHKHSLTEDDIAIYVRQLCDVLAHMHSKNCIHLDIRPTNIRIQSGRELKLLDYNSARQVANKKAGEVVDVIGDTEFCAPEMLRFEPVLPGSDMWSVGVIMYILLSGISPFYYEDEQEVLSSVQKVKWSFDEDAFDTITSEAKDFISKCFVRIPEMRMRAEQALKHKWLSNDYQRARKASVIKPQDTMVETDERLYSEEQEDYIEASLEFRTFEEEEYESPEESEEESGESGEE